MTEQTELVRAGRADDSFFWETLRWVALLCLLGFWGAVILHLTCGCAWESSLQVETINEQPGQAEGEKYVD